MPHHFKKTALFAALLAFGIAGSASAQLAPKSKPPVRAPSSLSHDDRDFANKAGASGIANVEMGRVAQQVTKNAEVKKFADRIVADHGRANDELKALAAAKGITLPASPSRVTHMKMEKMAKETGAKFDQEYLEHMIEDHKKDIKEFEKQAKTGKDPDLTKWAADKLPTLQGHLKLAETAFANLKSGKKDAKKK
jgi:putative membrane protein